MSATLVRTLVVGALLSLVFPPGWCCAALADREPAPGDEKPRGKCCCCDEPAPEKPPAPEPHPGPPPCCCHREAPAPPERVAPDDLSALTALVPPAPGPSLAPARHPVPAEAGPPALAPPRNVLHCVWLC